MLYNVILSEMWRKGKKHWLESLDIIVKKKSVNKLKNCILLLYIREVFANIYKRAFHQKSNIVCMVIIVVDDLAINS